MGEEDPDDTFPCLLERVNCPRSEIRMLACHHTLCIGCLEGTVTEALNCKDVIAKLKCPYAGCDGKIDKFMIMTNLPHLFDQYSDAVSGKALIDCMKPDEVLLYPPPSICPTIDCSYRALSRKKDQKLTCKRCLKSYCPHCKLPPHYNSTCEAALEASKPSRSPVYALLSAREVIEELNRKTGRTSFALCPKCGMQCERKDGCDLVDCDSQYCQGTTSFCIKCVKVVRTRHMCHRCDRPDPEPVVGPMFMGINIFDRIR